MGTVKRKWTEAMSYHSELDGDIRALGTTPQECVQIIGACGLCGGPLRISGLRGRIVEFKCDKDECNVAVTRALRIPDDG
jgi:hypothetical protein